MRPDLDANNKNRKVKRGLNENYGRELMELHTLGVNGGLHAEGRHGSGALLHRLDHPGRRREGGGFFYNDRLHDKGEKIVLGHVIPAGGGMEDGEQGARYPGAASRDGASYFAGAGAALRRR